MVGVVHHNQLMRRKQPPGPSDSAVVAVPNEMHRFVGCTRLATTSCAESQGQDRRRRPRATGRERPVPARLMLARDAWSDLTWGWRLVKLDDLPTH